MIYTVLFFISFGSFLGHNGLSIEKESGGSVDIELENFIKHTKEAIPQFDDCSGCNIALAADLMTIMNSTDLKTKQEIAISYLNSLSFNEWEQISDQETGIGISAILKGVPVSLDFDQMKSNEQYSKMLKELTTYGRNQKYSLDWNQTFIKVANKNLTNAWLECKKLCFDRDSKSLIKSFAKFRDTDILDDDIFEVHLKVQPQYGITDDKVVSVTLINCLSEDNQQVEAGSRIVQTNDDIVYLFRIINPSKPATVKIDFEKAGTQNLLITPVKNSLPVKENYCSATFAHSFEDFGQKTSLKSYVTTYVGVENVLTRPFYYISKQRLNGVEYYLLFTAGWEKTNNNLMGFWIAKRDFDKYFCFIEEPKVPCPSNTGVVSFRIKDYYNPGNVNTILPGWLDKYGDFKVYRESITNLGISSTNQLPSSVSKVKCAKR